MSSFNPCIPLNVILSKMSWFVFKAVSFVVSLKARFVLQIKLPVDYSIIWKLGERKENAKNCY